MLCTRLLVVCKLVKSLVQIEQAWNFNFVSIPMYTLSNTSREYFIHQKRWLSEHKVYNNI